MIDSFVGLIHGDSGWGAFWKALGGDILVYFEDIWFVFRQCDYLSYAWSFIRHLFHIVTDYKNRWKSIVSNFLCTYTYYRDGDDYSSGKCYGTFWQDLVRLD